MQSKTSRPALAVAMVVAAAACYATLPALVKVAYDHGADANGLLALRFGIAAPVVVVYVAITRGTRTLRVALPALTLAGVIYAIQTLSFFESLARMSASVAVLILFAYPLIVAVGGAIFLGERLTLRSAALIGIGSAGVALSVGFAGSVDTLGIVLASISALSFAIFFLVAKQQLSRRPWLDGVTVTAVTYIAAGIGFPLLMLAKGGSVPDDGTGWLVLAIITLFGTLAAAILLYSGLRHLPAASASMLSAAEPPLAVAFAAILLSEPVSLTQVVGIAIVVVSLGMLGYSASREEPAEIPPAP